MNTQTGTEPIVKEIRIAATPETVFEFFTEPAQMTRWLCSEATVDLRVGGVYHQTHKADDGKLYHLRSKFIEITPPRRLVFTWMFDKLAHGVEWVESSVEVTFEPDGDGTLVRLVHHNVPEPLHADHSRGWTTLLERLHGVLG
jgi:uncharacterized protein YndB with AHSA1/START domain